MLPKLKAVEGISHKDAIAKIGKTWNTLDDKNKKKYNELHDADIIRYEKQLKEWTKKGYYLMEGGIKSTELANPKKKKEKYESKFYGKKKRSTSASFY